MNANRAKRITINQEFESFDAFVERYVTNVSRSGAFLRCDDPPGLGQNVVVSFTVIAGDIYHIEAAGSVARTEADGVGVRFTEFRGDSEASLNALLREN